MSGSFSSWKIFPSMQSPFVKVLMSVNSVYFMRSELCFKSIRKLGLSSVVASPKILTMDTINPNVKAMEYAVRGPIVMRCVEIERELAQGKRFLFKNVIKANIGDCHAMGQTPITFVRQVVACITVPELMDSIDYPQDVKEHAKDILYSCAGGSVGAYSQSTGIELIRRHVAQFIERRDGHPCDWDNVILSGGASESIRNVLKLFINKNLSRKTGVMIPVPQYPLYSATIEEFNLTNVGYYLDETNNWALDIEELERSFEEGKAQCDIKALVVINPGNPTGQVLSRENIEMIIKFAYKHNLYIFADEVYQENVYAAGSRFFSFRKIILEMGEPYCHMELASFYSCSKGYMGECGLRGGYVELLNMDEQVMAAMDCIVNHPKPGDPSYDLWIKEKTDVLDSLKERAKLVTDAYNAIEGITVQRVQGAMYAFPAIDMPRKVIELAKEQNLEPDFLYVKELLEETGVCVVPGSGFGQKPGTWHFRATILPQPDTFKDMLVRFTRFHENFLRKYA